jgi:phosphoribosylformimino-5-aminoimidazole carboxamide ribotide isomerase
MEVIPAIDLRRGRCVRLFQGRFDQETQFPDEPCQVARRWESEGARRLHVVDLDRSKDGVTNNLDLVAQIVRAVRIPVQLGGGLRSKEAIAEVLRLGVTRAVVGPAILEKEDPQALFAEFGDRLILSIDARDGKVAARGWQEDTEFSALDLARQMEQLGAKRFAFTDIVRDGTLTGPNVEAVRALVEAVSVPVIAAGGVGKIEDVQALFDSGVEGVIVGKALYVGSVSLKEAVALC